MHLRRGDCGPEVVDVRYLLAGLGLLAQPAGVVPEEEDFDDDLDRAVRSFQQSRGLLVDGVIGPNTLRTLRDSRWDLGKRTLSYTLSAPMSGDDVVDLQRRLSGLGYALGQIDGIFGPATDLAVREFQADCQLDDDGVVGPSTVAELTRIRRPMVSGARPQYLREVQIVRAAGPTLSGKRIAIDAGHGPGDECPMINGLTRAAVSWNIARLLEARMTATGIETFLTRGRHDNPSGFDRAARANDVAADLLLSVHVDACKSPKANGLATFHFGTDAGHASTVGANLAELIHRELRARTALTDCRVHHATWDLLRTSRMPAVQIEIGYFTNDDDRARITDPAFQSKVAEGILVAVKRLYLDQGDQPHTGTISLTEIMAFEQAQRSV